MRTIDADALKYAIVEEGQKSKRYKLGEFWELNGDEIWQVIDAQPTIAWKREKVNKEKGNNVIEEAPSAQPERKKGEWINRSLNILYPEFERYTCSVCGKHSYSYDFCPNCGADMRGEQDE